jgi:predicted phosphate transport protein (TIGR00153 family)
LRFIWGEAESSGDGEAGFYQSAAGRIRRDKLIKSLRFFQWCCPMFSRLMPREAKFFDLFNAHADLVVKGGRQLVVLVHDLGKGPEVLAQHVQAIDEIESAADKITHETIALLHTSFNTPLDRDEIHQLIMRMDDILDLIQDFAEAMHLYDIRQLTPEARQLSDIVASSCERVKSAVILLNKMDNAPAMLKLCREIDQLESDADRAMRTGITKLFRDDVDVRLLIKMKGIYELLESVTDRCEDVANIIEGIILENS